MVGNISLILIQVVKEGHDVKNIGCFTYFILFFLALAIIADINIFDLNMEDIYDPEVGNPLLSIFFLAMFMPIISLGARRLHDIGKSGWLQLITLIPFIGFIVLLVFFVCKDSDPLENKYGTSPKLIASSTDVENL